MAFNSTPRFSGAADPQWGSDATPGTVANTTKDLTSGTIHLIYTAPTDGGIVPGLWVMPLGTNVATVMRAFLNNGSTTATATNQRMIGQLTCPATTNTETAALNPLWLPFPRPLWDVKAAHRIYVTFGTATAAGFHVTAPSSKFAV